MLVSRLRGSTTAELQYSYCQRSDRVGATQVRTLVFRFGGATLRMMPRGAAHSSTFLVNRGLVGRSSVDALILENSRTSTSIYIFKNINFSKLQRVNGECLGV